VKEALADCRDAGAEEVVVADHHRLDEVHRLADLIG
jgi:hypothetical protein